MAKVKNAKVVKAPDMGYVFNRDGSCAIVVKDHNIRKMPEEIAKAICDKYHGRTK